MAYGGGTIVDPDSAFSGGAGAGGGAARPPAATPAARQLQLAELHAADPSKGFSTPYYSVNTNSGDLAAAFYANDGQRVRLVDPKTGEVLVEGKGPQGAQQIATLAQAVSSDLGRKAAWQIQLETGPGDQFTTVGGDRADPKSHLLQNIIRIAGPLIGAAIPIPGLNAAVGAALGGFGSTLATGGSLKQALLSAATSGIGNAAGGALSDVFRGLPVSLSGVNPLGSLLGHAGDALSGITGAVGGGAGGAGASLTDLGFGALAPGYGGAAAGGALSSIGNTIAPLTVTAAGTPSLTSAITAGIGSGLGALTPGGTTSSQPAGQQPTELDPLTVTAAQPGGGLPVPDLTSLPGSVDGLTSSQPAQPSPTLTDQIKDTGADIAGQTLGGVGADLGVYGLSQVLGLLPTPPGGGAVGDGAQTIPTPGFDGTPDVGPLPGSGGTPDPSLGGVPAVTPPVLPGTTVGAPAGADGGALGQVLGPASFGTPGGGGAPLAAAPNLNVRGSTAPDIYPWRKRIAA